MHFSRTPKVCAFAIFFQKCFDLTFENKKTADSRVGRFLFHALLVKEEKQYADKK